MSDPDRAPTLYYGPPVGLTGFRGILYGNERLLAWGPAYLTHHPGLLGVTPDRVIWLATQPWPGHTMWQTLLLLIDHVTVQRHSSTSLLTIHGLEVTQTVTRLAPATATLLATTIIRAVNKAKAQPWLATPA